MINALIIDDENKSIQVLSKLIEKYCPEVNLVGSAGNSLRAMEMMNEHKPDLLFLDIEMPGFSGFELLEQIKEPTFKVIFVTGHEHYALKAIRASALDYLLKPVSIAQLKLAMDRYLQNNTQQEVKKLMTLTENRHKLNKIAIPTSLGFDFISTDDIIWMQASESYTILHLKDKTTLVSSQNLKVYEELLETSLFVRIHHSHMINLNHLEKYLRNKNAHVLMSDGHQLEVSQRKKDMLLQLIQKTS